MARIFALAAIILLSGAFLLFSEYPTPSAPYHNLPKLYQLLRENPDAKTIHIAVSTLEGALDECQSKNQSWERAAKKEMFYNLVAIILSIVIFCMLGKRKFVTTTNDVNRA